MYTTFQRHSLHVGGTAQSAKRLITNGRYVKLCQHGFCTKKANFNLHWKFEVCTSTQLHIRPSSPSYSIIGDLQWFRIVPAKPLRSNVVSLWSYLIPLSGSLPGIISDRGGAGVLASGVLVSRSD